MFEAAPKIQANCRTLKDPFFEGLQEGFDKNICQTKGSSPFLTIQIIPEIGPHNFTSIFVNGVFQSILENL